MDFTQLAHVFPDTAEVNADWPAEYWRVRCGGACR